MLCLCDFIQGIALGRVWCSGGQSDQSHGSITLTAGSFVDAEIVFKAVFINLGG